MNQTEEALMQKRNGNPIEILIVDDEATVRNVFSDFCKSSPLFSVTTAGGGSEAIELVEKNKYDIVTIDLVMPDISGLEAIESIKAGNPHLPMVIITGNATDGLIEQAGRLGGCRVLHKPIGIEEFMRELIDLADEKCC